MTDTQPDTAALPSVPDGWTAYLHKYGDEVSHNARKWFGDHYKEVSVAAKNGLKALHLACDAVDKEAALRAQGQVNAAHVEADQLEAQAAAVRPAEARTDNPVSAPTSTDATASA